MINKKIRKFMKLLLRRFNLDLSTIAPGQSVDYIQHFNLDLVFDVGANTGQFAQSLRDRGYLGKIVSFEPLLSAHSTLLKNSKYDDDWYVHQRLALGSKQMSGRMHVSENLVSSSFLAMELEHLHAASDSRVVGDEYVQVETLDSVWQQYYTQGDRLMLKIDVQGFEFEVLEGAKTLLSKCEFVLLELSTTTLYRGQKLYFEFDEFLRSNNYEIFNVFPHFWDKSSGRLLQFDGLYKHRN